MLSQHKFFCVVFVLHSEQRVNHRSSSAPDGAADSLSATLAGFHHHVGQLLHFGCPSNIVQDGERLQILGHAAGGG